MINIILIVLGLALGSFVNALVYRFHELNQTASKAKTSNNLSIWQGRSICPNCGHQLAAIDLIPVVSWLWLGGKCRYCKKPISWQYPLVELVTAGLFVLSYYKLPTNNGLDWFQLAVWLVVLTGLIALAVYDIRWMLLPSKMILVLTIIAGLGILISAIWGRDFGLVSGALLGAIVLSGIFYALYQVSKGQWIGGGDVKIGVLLGALAGGVTDSLLLLFLASLIGSIISIPLLINGKAKVKSRLPFGPFLIAACIIVVLFGGDFWEWYRHVFTLGAI